MSKKVFAELETALINAVDEVHRQLIGFCVTADEVDQIWNCDTVIWSEQYGYLLDITNVASFVTGTKIAINTQKFVPVIVCLGQGLA